MLEIQNRHQITPDTETGRERGFAWDSIWFAHANSAFLSRVQNRAHLHTLLKGLPHSDFLLLQHNPRTGESQRYLQLTRVGINAQEPLVVECGVAGAAGYTGQVARIPVPESPEVADIPWVTREAAPHRALAFVSDEFLFGDQEISRVINLVSDFLSTGQVNPSTYELVPYATAADLPNLVRP